MTENNYLFYLCSLELREAKQERERNWNVDDEPNTWGTRISTSNSYASSRNL